MTTEQKKRLLKAKIAVALHDELGRVPTQKEIEQVFLMARVMYKAVLGLHFKRKEQKKREATRNLLKERIEHRLCQSLN
jgi:hypothetical protein